MKVTVGEKVKETKQFPKYMYSKITKLVVLMTEPKVGIVTTSDGVREFGYQANDWVMGCFTDVESPEVAQSIKPFPKTMISKSGCIVFFERAELGMVLEQGCGSNKSGKISATWEMICFKDCDFPVTLQND